MTTHSIVIFTAAFGLLALAVLIGLAAWIAARRESARDARSRYRRMARDAFESDSDQRRAPSTTEPSADDTATRPETRDKSRR